jgi:hypothetical protein
VIWPQQSRFVPYSAVRAPHTTSLSCRKPLLFLLVNQVDLLPRTRLTHALRPFSRPGVRILECPYRRESGTPRFRKFPSGVTAPKPANLQTGKVARPQTTLFILFVLCRVSWQGKPTTEASHIVPDSIGLSRRRSFLQKNPRADCTSTGGLRGKCGSVGIRAACEEMAGSIC